MTVAAGIIFKSPEGNVLLTRRTDGKGWAIPAGITKDNETVERCAVREALEETGFRTGHTGKFLCRRVGDGVDFTYYSFPVDEEFKPKLNFEHDAYVWVNPDFAPQPLHPGLGTALRKLKGMNELELAEAIRDGELVSPQFIENVCLVDMRISGTGFSYRPKFNEWVYRRDTIYLTEEFLRRCNGAPVIMDHPTTQILTSDEFAKRIVGTMFLPYIKDTEVWGIAKLYDKEAIRLVLDNQMSTSPSVVFRDVKVNYTIDLEEGGTLLVEGEPSFVDHLAICEKGVWDKGGEPSGIRIDSEGAGEPQEKVVTAKLDEMPEVTSLVTGEGNLPTPLLQSIPPDLHTLADGMTHLADRIAKFIARRNDLMVR